MKSTLNLVYRFFLLLTLAIFSSCAPADIVGGGDDSSGEGSTDGFIDEDGNFVEGLEYIQNPGAVPGLIQFNTKIDGVSASGVFASEDDTTEDEFNETVETNLDDSTAEKASSAKYSQGDLDLGLYILSQDLSGSEGAADELLIENALDITADDVGVYLPPLSAVVGYEKSDGTKLAITPIFTWNSIYSEDESCDDGDAWDSSSCTCQILITVPEKDPTTDEFVDDSYDIKCLVNGVGVFQWHSKFYDQIVFREDGDDLNIFFPANYANWGDKRVLLKVTLADWSIDNIETEVLVDSDTYVENFYFTSNNNLVFNAMTSRETWDSWVTRFINLQTNAVTQLGINIGGDRGGTFVVSNATTKEDLATYLGLSYDVDTTDVVLLDGDPSGNNEWGQRKLMLTGVELGSDLLSSDLVEATAVDNGVEIWSWYNEQEELGFEQLYDACELDELPFLRQPDNYHVFTNGKMLIEGEYVVKQQDEISTTVSSPNDTYVCMIWDNIGNLISDGMDAASIIDVLDTAEGSTPSDSTDCDAVVNTYENALGIDINYSWTNDTNYLWGVEASDIIESVFSGTLATIGWDFSDMWCNQMNTTTINKGVAELNLDNTDGILYQLITETYEFVSGVWILEVGGREVAIISYYDSGYDNAEGTNMYRTSYIDSEKIDEGKIDIDELDNFEVYGAFAIGDIIYFNALDFSTNIRSLAELEVTGLDADNNLQFDALANEETAIEMNTDTLLILK